MKKFNAGIEKNLNKSAWWDLINELTKNVSVPMVEEKFSVESEGESESIFDLVLRTGLASTFQEAVALLINTFPPTEPPPQTLWQKIMNMISTGRERKY